MNFSVVLGAAVRPLLLDSGKNVAGVPSLSASAGTVGGERTSIANTGAGGDAQTDVKTVSA